MEYREKLVQRIRDAGLKIIDRAEEIAAPSEAITNLDISVHLSADPFMVDEIEWATIVINKNQYKRLIKKEI